MPTSEYVHVHVTCSRTSISDDTIDGAHRMKWHVQIDEGKRRPTGRRRMTTTIAYNLLLGILLLFGPSLIRFVDSAVWTNGPEDRFFCGFKWDDKDCQKRQHCPSGRSEDCEGFENGIKCFANTNCDTRYGDGDWFVPGQPPRQSPGGTSRPTYGEKSDDKTDHYWCGVGMDDARNQCGTHCPGGTSSECPPGNICYHDIYTCDARNLHPPTPYPTYSMPPSMGPMEQGPTKIPTEMPIGPPDPLGPSSDLTVHWFCGIGIDDANSKCRVHCPSASECPMGQICYFGTQCDSRTFAPTPPPTRRPTPLPTMFPTASPTLTMPPTLSPTFTNPPSAAPSEQIPTQSPTPSPTKRPTYAPMPSLQSSFFCGSNWQDAITNCKRRCPTGESTECPFDENCFSLTPCTEEMGYPEEYGLGEGGGKSEISGGGESEDCVPFVITINADHWPKETSWKIENTEFEDEEYSVIAQANSDALVPGTPVEYVECVNNRNGCYQFTIHDTGGDGICCEHGNGLYKISYDGVELKQGGTFYDDEKTSFGLCGASPETNEPTKKPTAATVSSGSGSSKGSNHRCVANHLVESGYAISRDKCDLFVDCFNEHINIGDEWFCGENESCVEAPACGTEEAVSGGSHRCVAMQLAQVGYKITSGKCNLFDSCNFEGDDSSCDETSTCIEAPDCNDETPASVSQTTNKPTNKPVPITTTQNESPNPPTNKPTPIKVVTRPEPATRPNVKPPTPAPVAVTVAKIVTDSPTETPTELITEEPTLPPTTFRPTYGPCDGDPCFQENHCRSRYGYCGHGDTYCNDDAIWTKECPAPEPTVRPSASPVSEPPTRQPVTLTPIAIPVFSTIDNAIGINPPTPRPSQKKPSGFKKPGGGKGTASKPSRPALSHSQITYRPTRKPTKQPMLITTAMPTNDPTERPSFSPLTMIGSFLLNPTTAPPTPEPTQPPWHRPTPRPSFSKPYTNNPTPGPLEFEEEVSTDGMVETEAEETIAASLDTSPVEIEPGCEGEPCPVDTHCRSRYGSCGPGFIYCNAYSTWKSSCPPLVPGTRPTKKPTTKPTREPSVSAKFAANPIAPTASLPTLPKPTLPWITGENAIPYVPPTSSSSKQQSFTESVESATTDGDNSDEPAPSPKAAPEPGVNEFSFQNWIRSASHCNHATEALIVISTVTALLLLLL